MLLAVGVEEVVGAGVVRGVVEAGVSDGAGVKASWRRWGCFIEDSGLESSGTDVPLASESGGGHTRSQARGPSVIVSSPEVPDKYATDDTLVDGAVVKGLGIREHELVRGWKNEGVFGFKGRHWRSIITAFGVRLKGLTFVYWRLNLVMKSARSFPGLLTQAGLSRSSCE